MWNKFGLKVLAVLTALVMVVSSVAMYGYNAGEVEKGISEGGGKGVISLMPPPFIGIAGAAEAMGGGGEGAGASTVSLSNESGISAYLNAGSINLNQARTAYKSIDTETSEYIIGIVQISGVDESIYPRVYTNKDGWILAYLPKDEPASAIVQWQGYTGGAITRTTLEDGISKVCKATKKNCTRDNVSYYDFRFPEANRMLWVVERVTDFWEENPFNFTIQNELVVYNGSWSFDASSLSADLRIDGDIICSLSVFGGDYGYYNATHLEKGVTHNVELIAGGSSSSGKTAEAATIITYKVPT